MFLRYFEEFYIKILIDYYIITRDYPKSNRLIKRVVHTIKCTLHKYRLLLGNYNDNNLNLSQIKMVYCFNQQASLASFSTFQLMYGKESMLLLAIKEKLDPIVDLDNLKVYIQILQV